MKKLGLKKTLVTSMLAIATSMVVVAAAQAAGVTKVSPASPRVPGQGVLYNAKPALTPVQGQELYTTEQVETSILTVRDISIDLRNATEDMVRTKKYAIKTDLENLDEGASDEINGLLGEVLSMLKVDGDLWSEKDPVAMKEIETLKIKVGESEFALPKDVKVTIMGESLIQAFPLVDAEGNKLSAHIRGVCGGVDTDDVIVNRKSYSYCVTTLIATGYSRNSGVHRKAVTPVFYVGVTEPYIAGGAKTTVGINWNTIPKNSPKRLLEYYGIDKVKHALDTLEYRNNITLSDGTVLAGRNARMSK